jgi:hypothetical protein
VLLLVIVGGLAWIFVPREYRAAIVGYKATSDPRTIVVQTTLGPDDTLLGTEIREEAGRVVVVVKARDTSKAYRDGGDNYFLTITLKDPLAGRKLISGSDLPGLAGMEIPERP